MPLVILPLGYEHVRDPCLGCRLMVEDAPSPQQSCKALCREGPWETQRGLFEKTVPGWGRIKQPPLGLGSWLLRRARSVRIGPMWGMPGARAGVWMRVQGS